MNVYTQDLTLQICAKDKEEKRTQEKKQRTVWARVGKQKRDSDVLDFLTLSLAALRAAAAAVFSGILLLSGVSWGDMQFPTPTTSLQVKQMFA